MRLAKCVVCCFIGLLAIPVVAFAWVENGIDRLFKVPYWSWVAGKRVGLVANNDSQNRAGQRTIDLLYEKKGIKLVRIFTPEHGLKVTVEGEVEAKDPKTQVPISVLYGTKKILLDPADFKDIDVLVFDLQTVGLRYFTYTASLAAAMKAAKQRGIPIVVLDRVNPLGGKIVSGARLDAANIGHITSYFNVPTRYGLTIGEMARYAHDIKGIQANLQVVPIAHWQRNWLFNQTKLAWVAPSPRLQTFEQAYLYAVFGPLEALNLSVGLGKASPYEFHYYGAPYVTVKEARQILAGLQAAHLPGLSFGYWEWQAKGMKFDGKRCRGIFVKVTDYKKVEDFFSLVTLLKIMHQVLGEKLVFKPGFDVMLGQAWIREAILRDVPTEVILERVQRENAAYQHQRQKVLLYH